MSQLQGQSMTEAVQTINSKERPADAAKAGYWPGHVIAECLMDDTLDNSLINTQNESPISNKTALNNNNSSSSSDKFSSKNISPNLVRLNSKTNDTNITNDNNIHPKSPTPSTKETESFTRESKSIGIKLKPGSAFSAITNSMLPVDIIKNNLLKLNKNQSENYENNNGDNDNVEEFIYDEFGFRIENDEDEAATQNDQPSLIEIDDLCRKNNDDIALKVMKKQLNEQLYIEDSKHKLKWIAYLEFTLNADLGSNFSWDQVTTLNRCEKLRGMIRGQGIPHSLRPFIWMRLSGALYKKQNSTFKYIDVLKNAEQDAFHTSKQIDKDLLRTLPTNACFCSIDSVGIPRLRRVLQSLAYLYPNIGYCQGMNTIVATLLLFVEEEDTFWMMCTLVEDILPVSYYSHTLLGVQADIKVLGQLIGTYLPDVDYQLKKHDIELSLICINWFLTIFSNVLHIKILLRVWDLFFYEGSTAMFQITLAMLKLNEKRLVEAQNSSQIFTLLSDLPSEICDIDLLIETSIRIASSVNKNILDVSRKKHQAYLMAQHGTIINPSNYQNLPLTKERPNLRNKQNENRGKALLKLFKKSSFKNDLNNNVDNQSNNNSNEVKSISNNNSNVEDLNEIKMKNIIQTELLVNLREIILKIVNHFQIYDPDGYKDCNVNADYSIESHARDYENYMDNTKERQFKRAKALHDFEKTEDDELGFLKHDIITVLSTKDDHCWIGELNGEKGWFPSRFVQLIDERNGKIYSPAGDDSVNDRINDLIRGELALVLKSIFEYGLKKWTVLGGHLHPWSFIEEASKKVVEKDFDSVYSRLVLCKTFRLDEDGKVLTPDELLFRTVQMINMSHDSIRTELDVKFRTLLCVGLNEQVLHIWLETLCSSLETIEKWYHPWSFLRSPGWVQIKCELRILAKLSFLLNTEAELPDNKKDAAINECIKDMLVKHHLFSWDIN